MIYVAWASAFFIALIMQGSLSLFDIMPNFTVLLAFYAGIRSGDLRGLAAGALMGIIEDSLTGTFIGPNLLSKGLVGYMSSFLYQRFFVWNPLLGTISVAVFTFADSMTVFLLRSMFDRMPVGAGAALMIIFAQSVLNAPFGLFLRPRKTQTS